MSQFIQPNRPFVESRPSVKLTPVTAMNANTKALDRRLFQNIKQPADT